MEIEKKRLCVRMRSGDKHHLRKSSETPPEKIFRSKSTNQSGERNERVLICAFWSEDFLRWCLSPERNLTHNLLFLFPIVFGINLIHFFDEKKDDSAEKSIACLGASIPCQAVTPFDRGKTIAKSANFTKNANCFEECNVFGNGKCELSAIQEGRN